MAFRKAKMPGPRFTALHPQGSYNETKDVVDRLLMDSMADECFVLQSIRGKVDPETLDEVRKGAEQHRSSQPAHR